MKHSLFFIIVLFFALAPTSTRGQGCDIDGGVWLERQAYTSTSGLMLGLTGCVRQAKVITPLQVSNDTLRLINGGTIGYVLTWNGTIWIPAAPTGADNWGTQVVQRDSSLQGNGTTASPLGIKGYGAASNGQVPSKSAGGITWIDVGASTTDLSYTGASSPVTLNSSTGTDVTITAGAGISLSATGSDLTITNTDPDQLLTNEGVLGVDAGGGNDALLTSNTSGAVGVTVSGSTTVKVTETTSANGGTILLQADTAILATLNDLRPIIDTVKDYGRLRLYNGQAALVFVSQDGIQGIFKRVTSGVDDGGINIVGTNKWRRVAEELRIVNVRWFGAVGDSVTNDNTAIQAAVAFCKDSTNATLYFPKGKYRYTATISFYKPVNLAIKGDGMHNTYLLPVNVTGIRIRTDSTTTVVDSKYGVKEARDFTLTDFSMLRVGANNFNGKIQGIDLRGGFNKKLENVRVEEFFGQGGTGQGSIGIRLWPTLATNDATQHTILQNVYVTECDTGIVSRLQNTLILYDVKIDQCKDLGLMLSSALTWVNGLCQGNENCGIWLNNSNPFVLNEVTIQNVHFEGNAYVAPKWGGIYKNDNTDMTDLSIKNCLLSSPGNTHMIRMRRVQKSEFVNNRYSGSATTDTISLTSFYNVIYGNDNYTALKLVTSDAYITWLNGTAATNDEYNGLTVNTAAAGKSALNTTSIAVGATYAVTNAAPTDGAIIQGSVGVGNTSPQRKLHVTGEARITDLVTDTPTGLVGADADGDLATVALATGLSIVAGTLTPADNSATNESLTISDGTDSENLGGQTLTVAGAGNVAVDYVPATNTLTINGVADGDGSPTNEGILGVGAGGANDALLTSNTSGANGVTYSGGTGITVSESTSANGGTITITNAGDLSSTNEAWTIDGDDADTELITTQTVKFQGGGINVTDYNPTTDVLLITGTEVDGSTTNELQTLANTSDATSHTVTLSSSGGSVQLIEGSNITLTTGGTGLNGTVTIAASGGAAVSDSTWSKSVGGGYANKRITDPVYRSSAIRVNMTGDSAALTLKYASTQTEPIFKGQFNNGALAFYGHVYPYNNTNSLTNANIIFGKAGTFNTLSFKNTVFGITSAAFPSGAENNTLFGYLAGNSLNGGYQNSCFGGDAGAALSTGFQNSFFGYLAGAGTNTGYQNMFIGRRAGTTNQDGFGNSAIGADALRLNVSGDLNVAIGQQAGDGILGSSNTIIGAAAGRLTTGSGNIFVGYSAGELLTAVSNLLIIDNSNTSTPLIGGDLSSNEVSINLDPATAARSLDVNGEVRIRDLVTDTPTKIVGADADGDLDTVGIGAEAELHLTNGTLGTNLHTTISPSNLTAGMTNNWNPTGLATAWIIRMSGDDKFEIVTGITAPSFAKRLTIHNTGSNAILFATDNTSSTAGNRFSFGRDIVLFAGKSIEIIYDPTSARWRLLSKAGIYDDVENQYFNTAFQAPVSLTTAEHDFWEISSTGTATAVTPTNGLLRGVSVNTGTSATGCGDVASKEQFVSVNTVDGAATWGYVKAKIVTPSSLSNGTNDYALRIGFLAGECSSDLVEGAYFYYNHAINSGAWSCYTQNAGNSQNNNSGITVAASTIYTLEVVYRPNISVEFFINGTRVATNDTNVPDSDTMKVLAEIEKQGGTSQRDLQVYLLQTSIAHVN